MIIWFLQASAIIFGVFVLWFWTWFILNLLMVFVFWIANIEYSEEEIKDKAKRLAFTAMPVSGFILMIYLYLR